ncbi:hypothetical protein HRG_012814 [Hirsutella rhossiliensis]
MRLSLAIALAAAALLASAGIVISPIEADQVVLKVPGDCFFGESTTQHLRAAHTHVLLTGPRAGRTTGAIAPATTTKPTSDGDDRIRQRWGDGKSFYCVDTFCITSGMAHGIAHGITAFSHIHGTRGKASVVAGGNHAPLQHCHGAHGASPPAGFYLINTLHAYFDISCLVIYDSPKIHRLQLNPGLVSRPHSGSPGGSAAPPAPRLPGTRRRKGERRSDRQRQHDLVCVVNTENGNPAFNFRKDEVLHSLSQLLPLSRPRRLPPSWRSKVLLVDFSHSLCTSPPMQARRTMHANADSFSPLQDSKNTRGFRGTGPTILPNVPIKPETALTTPRFSPPPVVYPFAFAFTSVSTAPSFVAGDTLPAWEAAGALQWRDCGPYWRFMRELKTSLVRERCEVASYVCIPTWAMRHNSSDILEEQSERGVGRAYSQYPIRHTGYLSIYSYDTVSSASPSYITNRVD